MTGKHLRAWPTVAPRLPEPVPRPTRTVAWACEDSRTPDVFFPTSQEDLVAAKALCSGCPALLLCRQRGRDLRADGVWGGVLLRGGKPSSELFPPERRRKAG